MKITDLEAFPISFPQAGVEPGTVDKDGNVRPCELPGLGLEMNEDFHFLKKHPPIEGPGYI